MSEPGFRMELSDWDLVAAGPMSTLERRVRCEICYAELTMQLVRNVATLTTRWSCDPAAHERYYAAFEVPL